MSDEIQSPDKAEGQVIDNETGKIVPPPRRIDLSNLRDVRLELAHLYRRMDSGEIPSIDGSKRAFVLKLIADVITVADIERRLIELEESRALPRVRGQGEELTH